MEVKSKGKAWVGIEPLSQARALHITDRFRSGKEKSVNAAQGHSDPMQGEAGEMLCKARETRFREEKET